MANMEELSGININKPEISVKHLELEIFDKSSIYKRICPVCNIGILPVTRDWDTLEVKPNDMCLLCGQKVFYTDFDEWKDI